MDLILGTSALAAVRNYGCQAKIRSFLQEVYSHGSTQIDTAPLYSSLDAEKLLGRTFPEDEFPDILISTKMGYRYSSAIFPLNRVYSRIAKLKNGGSPVKQFKVSPELELKSSLNRLNRKKVHTFFLHDVDNPYLIDLFLRDLISLKQKGSMQEIGIATRSKYMHVPEEIDSLQIPYHLVEHYSKRVFCKFQVHSLFADGQITNGCIAAKIDKLKNVPQVSSIVLGTTNISHYTQIWEMVQLNG